MWILYLHPPWNILLSKPWVVNVYYTMVILRKLAGPRSMFTTVMKITITPQ